MADSTPNMDANNASESENSPAIVPVQKLDFFARRKKQVERWWSNFFVEEAYIPDDIRKICGRYGERVISTMLAGNSSPKSEDLEKVYQTETTREYARAWLSEETAYNTRRDHWISLRDFILEAFIVGLILWEIHMGYRQEQQQAQNFQKQQAVLTNLGTSSQATASNLTSLKTTTEAMNESVKRSAAATEANAATSAQTLHMSERAYLAVTVSMPTPPKAGDKIHAIVTISNAGKGLAIDVVTSSRSMATPKGTPPEAALASAIATMPTTQYAPSKSPLAAGQQIQQVMDSPLVLTEDGVTKIENQSEVIYAFVDAKYKDLFGRQHRTEACAFYYPPTKQMVNCSTLNKAD